MASTPTATMFESNGTTIYAGVVTKTATGPLQVFFNNMKPAFSDTPVVTLCPYWPKGKPVGDIETVIDVDAVKFTFNSGNNAPNYQVMWMAIGPTAT
jgi:hypothetical protein